MNRFKFGSMGGWLVALVVGALLPFIVSDPYILHLLIICCIYVVLALSLNLLFGFAGQSSFAHAAFFGIGAYTSAILAKQLGVPFLLSFLASGIVTGVISLLIALPSLRLRGPYLTIATIGFQQIVVVVMSQWVSLTRGPMGITNIPKPQFGSLVIKTLPQWYMLAFVLVVLTVIIMLRISKSRLGLELVALREEEMAARSVGVNTVGLKIIAFALSSLLAGMAGSIYAYYINSIDPYSFVLGISATILVMVLAGGAGSIVGSVVGAIVLTLIPEVLRQFVNSGLRMVFFGVAMTAIILFMPEGFAGLFKQILTHRSRGRVAEEGLLDDTTANG